MKGSDGEDLSLVQSLSPRERDILDGMGAGLTNRQMAARLTIAPGTVKWYVRQVYNKLGVSSRAEAVARAQRLGLLPDEEKAIRQNLPLAATPFVGREGELAALADLIGDPHARIITITGPGGIGKTRLALEAAGRELRPQALFPDGIFFVSLAPLESAGELVPAVAAALDLQFQGSGDETGQLLNYLDRKQMLLVMDNFEHILDGGMLLIEISKQAAGIKLLVTSRERLQMRGEQLFTLNGLEVAQGEDSAAQAPAARLFLHIARRTVPDFQLREGDAEHLLRICRLVEGMPLGLELAASWVGLLPLSEIAAEIERSLDLLTAEHSDVPQRHRSMEAALEVSWRRLNSEQRHAFQNLCVFRGGFTRSGAVGVAGVTLPLLVTLTNKSWLSYDWGSDRYHIHELLRQYGAQELAKSPTLESAVCDAHCQHYFSLVQRHEPDWRTARQLDALHVLAGEADNINTAWRRALKNEDWDSIFWAIESWNTYLEWRGRFAEGESLCRAIETRLERSPEKQPTHILLWSRALAWQGLFTNSNYVALKKLQESLTLLDRPEIADQDRRRERSSALRLLGGRYYSVDRKTARLHLEESLQLYRELDDAWGMAVCLSDLAQLDWGTGRYAEARAKAESALAIFKENGDRRMESEILWILGSIEQHQGNQEAAESLRHDVVDLCRRLGDREGLIWHTANLAYTQIFCGRFEEGLQTVDEGLVICQEYGQGYAEGYLRMARGFGAMHAGQKQRALQELNHSLALVQEANAFGVEATVHCSLGFLALAEGVDGIRAQHYFEEGRRLYEKVDDQFIGMALIGLGYAACRDKAPAKAREHLRESLAFCQKLEDSFFLMQTLPGVALYLTLSGEIVRSVEIWELARGKTFVANSTWYDRMVGHEIWEQARGMRPEVVKAAVKSGRELDVWETAEALLRELDGR